MNVIISIDQTAWPQTSDLHDVVSGAVEVTLTRLGRAKDAGELCIVLASNGAAAELNSKWRGKSGAD